VKFRQNKLNIFTFSAVGAWKDPVKTIVALLEFPAAVACDSWNVLHCCIEYVCEDFSIIFIEFTCDQNTTYVFCPQLTCTGIKIIS